MRNRIEKLCREYTDLTPDEIEEIIDASKRLGNIANLVNADAFIDCSFKDSADDAIVIAEAKPVGEVSAYKGSVVGMIATKEKEPAVFRSLSLGVPTKFVKAITQENINVVQTVEPIFHCHRCIGVYIIEQKMERWFADVADEISDVETEKVHVDENVKSRSFSSSVADTMDDGILFVNKEGVVVYANKAASKFYKEIGFISEITGSLYENFCLVNETEEQLKEPITVNYVKARNYYLKIKRVDIMRDELGFIISLADITAQKTQEQALVLKSAALKEMHHRVKNNLQTIASLLRLQRNKISSQEGKAAIDGTINRILAISSIHEIMLGSGMDVVKLNDTMASIKASTLNYFKSDDFKLEIECHGGDFDISMDKATAIALILNELMQNSLKYAFPNRTYGKVVVFSRKKCEDEIEIVFRDNGCGFDVEENMGSGSMGLTIIKVMVKEKLKGHLVMTSDNTGTEVKIMF